MTANFRIRVTKDHLTFCAGHFISYEGDKCERLHGHNYRVAIEIEGPLDENHYVFDFIALKNLSQALTAELDHRMLLPLENPHILVAEADGQIEVRYRERRWSFPKDDCVLLPIANTTAELLAQYLAERLRQALEQSFQFVPKLMRVDVEESPGQSAQVTLKA
jgi:6-pyruvoyltetrahydropterin/6-carboxytetrahydropterin synthase